MKTIKQAYNNLTERQRKMNNKTNVKEEQFVIDWTFEFIEMIDGVKDESTPSNINLESLFEFGGWIIWFAIERKISFENYIKLVNGLATFTSENFLISFEKALSSLLHESLMFGVSR